MAASGVNEWSPMPGVLPPVAYVPVVSGLARIGDAEYKSWACYSNGSAFARLSKLQSCQAGAVYSAARITWNAETGAWAFVLPYDVVAVKTQSKREIAAQQQRVVGGLGEGDNSLLANSLLKLLCDTTAHDEASYFPRLLECWHDEDNLYTVLECLGDDLRTRMQAATHAARSSQPGSTAAARRRGGASSTAGTAGSAGSRGDSAIGLSDVTASSDSGGCSTESAASPASGPSRKLPAQHARLGGAAPAGAGVGSRRSRVQSGVGGDSAGESDEEASGRPGAALGTAGSAGGRRQRADHGHGAGPGQAHVLSAVSGCLSERTVRRYAMQLLQALHVMHSLGWCHRDISPENICLRHRPSYGGASTDDDDDSTDAVLVDFGTAARMSAAPDAPALSPRDGMASAGTSPAGSPGLSPSHSFSGWRDHAATQDPFAASDTAYGGGSAAAGSPPPSAGLSHAASAFPCADGSGGSPAPPNTGAAALAARRPPSWSAASIDSAGAAAASPAASGAGALGSPSAGAAGEGSCAGGRGSAGSAAPHRQSGSGFEPTLASSAPLPPPSFGSLLFEVPRGGLGGFLPFAPPARGGVFCKKRYADPCYAHYAPYFGVAFDLWSLAQTLFAAVVGSELYSLPLPEVDFAFNLLVRAEAAAALQARGPQHLVPEGHPARLVLQALAEEDGAAAGSAGSSVQRHPSAPLERQSGVPAGGGAAALTPPPVPDLVSARLPHSDSLTSIGAAAEFGGGDGGGSRMQLDGPTDGGSGAGTWRDPRHSGLEAGGRGDGSGDSGAAKQPSGVGAAELAGAPAGLSLSRLGSAETAVMLPAREILGEAPRPDVSASAAAAQIGVSAAASSAGSVEGVTAAMSAMGPGRSAGAAPRPPSSHLHLQREVSDGAATVGSAISVHALLPEGRMSLGDAGAGAGVRPSRPSDGDAGDVEAAAGSARVGAGQEAAVAREIFLHPNLVLHSTSLAKLLHRLSDRREGRGLPPLSPAFRDLMLRLFRLRPGYRPVCASVVLEHPWFTGLPLLVPRPLPVELPLASTIHPSLLNPGPARGLATAAAAPERQPHGREPAPAAIPHGADRAAAATEALAPRGAGPIIATVTATTLAGAGAPAGVVAEAPAGAGRGAERPSRRASSDSNGSTGPVRRWVSRSFLQKQARSSAGAGSPKSPG